jgi:hypothetical protein
VHALHTKQMHARLGSSMGGSGSDVHAYRETSHDIDSIQYEKKSVLATANTAAVTTADNDETNISIAVQEQDMCYESTRPLRYFSSPQGINYPGVVVVTLVLYVLWMITVLSASGDDVESMVTISFAWFWIPVLFMQMCHLVEIYRYAYVALISFMLLTAQQYWILGLQHSTSMNVVVDMFLLLQQTAYTTLQSDSKWVTLSVVLVSLCCVVLRIVTLHDVDMFVTVSLMNNTYLFILVILSMVTYPVGYPPKEKKECKQP